MDLAFWFEYWWMFPTAFTICVTVNIMGVSGSVLFLPLYTIIYPLLGIHVEPIQAIQLGLFTELFGFTSSTIAFWHRKLIDFQIARFALLAAVPTAILGGILSNNIPGSILLFVIGGTLTAFAYLLLRASSVSPGKSSVSPARTKKTHTDWQGSKYTYELHNDKLSLVLAAIGGFFQGLVGFSAGEINSSEQILRGTPVRIATGTAHLIIAIASLAAAITNITIIATQRSPLPWNILVMAVPAVLLGGQVAGFIAGKLPQHILQMILSRFLLLIGFISFYRACEAIGIQVPVWLLLIAVLIFLASVVMYLVTKRNLLPGEPQPAETLSENDPPLLTTDEIASQA